jgi:hypothetical protein
VLGVGMNGESSKCPWCDSENNHRPGLRMRWTGQYSVNCGYCNNYYAVTKIGIAKIYSNPKYFRILTVILLISIFAALFIILIGYHRYHLSIFTVLLFSLMFLVVFLRGRSTGELPTKSVSVYRDLSPNSFHVVSFIYLALSVLAVLFACFMMMIDF